MRAFEAAGIFILNSKLLRNLLLLPTVTEPI